MLSGNYLATYMGALAGSAAFKLEQRSHRGITVNSFDGFAQQPCHRKGGNLYSLNCRAQDSISSYKFVNLRFSQSFDADIVQKGMGDTGVELFGPLLVEQARGSRQGAGRFG